MPARRIALLLEYDGTRYAGSQLQENALTVQAVLEKAIEEVTGERTRVAFAGRTDAGVHALGQVAAMTTGSRLPAEVLQRALNARLPRDVVVREAVEADASFDPRRQAIWRHYRYLIANLPVRPALARERVWHVPFPLDTEAMRDAARRVTGRHDFRGFASPSADQGASTVRNLTCFSVETKGNCILIDAVANAFLTHQVRRMVGALVEVGRGRLTPAAYEAFLAAPRASAGPVAPSRGLYLVRVEYEPPLFSASLARQIQV